MAKFYRVIKDHPLWEVGAIVSNHNSNGYKQINDLFTKDLKENYDYSDMSEAAVITEYNHEFFERVYEHKVVGQVKYLTKSAAKKLMKEEYK